MEQTLARTSTSSTSSASITSLHAAKRAKNDEFYTQLTDIEKELHHYKDHFKGKVVFCNCDDPEWSNFWKYFTLNFKHLGLNKVVATHYACGEPSYKLEYFGPGKPPVKTALSGDGDFRSPECVGILKEADIVATNPPFSLFREYVAQLVEHKKKFLVIGSQNALTYKEIFTLIKDNAIWAGTENGGTKWFQVPSHYEMQTKSRIKIKDGLKYFSMGSVYWFTNLDIKKRHEPLVLYKTYRGNEGAYPRYDNHNAIDVSKVVDIPVDYEGFMGVPITFMDKYKPSQFEILGIMNTGEENPGIRLPKTEHGRPVIRGRELYLRILIRHKRASCVTTT